MGSASSKAIESDTDEDEIEEVDVMDDAKVMDAADVVTDDGDVEMTSETALPMVQLGD